APGEGGGGACGPRRLLEGPGGQARRPQEARRARRARRVTGQGPHVSHDGLCERKAGVYRNRTDWERCSHPPQVLKTRAGTSRANTPELNLCIVNHAARPDSRGSHDSRDKNEKAPARGDPPRAFVLTNYFGAIAE